MTKKQLRERHDKRIFYGFRKRYNTILKDDSKINPNTAEKLMGHKNGLDGVYYNPSIEKRFEEFKKAIFDLTISDTLDNNKPSSNKKKVFPSLKEIKTRLNIWKRELTSLVRYLQNKAQKTTFGTNWNIPRIIIRRGKLQTQRNLFILLMKKSGKCL